MNSEIIKTFKGKKIAILGLGIEGLSTYRFIRKYLPKLHLTLADRKSVKDLGMDFIKISKSDKNAAFVSRENYLSNLEKFDLIIKTPGIPNKLKEIQVAKGKNVEFTSQTAILLKFFSNKIIGVTGTKGKSTTASLIYHILKNCGKKVELLGNIGIPVLDYFDKGNNVDYFVFEMSSHQLSDVTESPHVAIFLNIFPEHLDYYEDFEDYLSAKAKIAKFQKTSDILVYNGRFSEIKKIAEASKSRGLDFSNINLSGLKTNLRGVHNIENIKAAYLIAREVGIKDGQILQAIGSFLPLEGRLEFVGRINGVDFINDTLATIPQAAIEAVKGFPNKQITLILGGFDRGLNFDILGEFLSSQKNVNNVILVGQTANKIKQALLKYGFKDKVHELGIASMKEIVKKASEITEDSGTVLLSPASTSFDMFKDYKDRGDQFRIAVQSLAK